MEKYAAVCAMIVEAVISGPAASAIRSLSTISASCEVDWICRLRSGERGDPNERALEFADVGRDPCWAMNSSTSGRHVQRCSGCRLLAQDRDASLELGRLDVGDQAPLEPVTEPVLQRDQLLGGAVAGDHDLRVGVVQGVEGVEELLLGLFLVLQELDVVDEEHVDVAVPTLAEQLVLLVRRGSS